jgi:hypothetical protein
VAPDAELIPASPEPTLKDVMQSVANMSLTFTSQIHQSITACEKNLKTQVENVEKSLENKILQSENTLTERLNHHEARMAALEAQLQQPQFPPALQNNAEASGLPMPPLPPPAIPGASAARATASRGPGPMHTSDATARDFVARKVMIGGGAHLKMRTGSVLNQMLARPFGD